MPQMMPINWMFLFVFFIMEFLIFNIMFFFFFFNIYIKNYKNNKFSILKKTENDN